VGESRLEGGNTGPPNANVKRTQALHYPVGSEGMATFPQGSGANGAGEETKRERLKIKRLGFDRGRGFTQNPLFKGGSLGRETLEVGITGNQQWEVLHRRRPLVMGGSTPNALFREKAFIWVTPWKGSSRFLLGMAGKITTERGNFGKTSRASGKNEDVLHLLAWGQEKVFKRGKLRGKFKVFR